MKIKLKRINKKRPWEKNEQHIIYSKYYPAEVTPIVGNWDATTPMKYITVSKKWFMTPEQITKRFKGGRYYRKKLRLCAEQKKK
jgi:hypothetical protein